MKSKPTVPAAEESVSTLSASADFLNRPEFEPVATIKKTRRVVMLLVPLLVLLLIAGAGYAGYRCYLAYRTTKSTAATSPAQPKATDPYAGWKTYSDAAYQYTFEYPAGWIVSSHTNLPGVIVEDPSHTVFAEYGMGQPEPGSQTISFTPTLIEKLTSSNQDLTVLGGYALNNDIGQYFPTYEVIDTSLVARYSLTVGREAAFTTVPTFTVPGTSTLGAFQVAPVGAVTSLSDAQAWLNSADAKSSLLMLLSLKHTADPTASWQTFTDNASVPPSGISVKYPSDWQVQTGGKTYAWAILSAHSGITVNTLFLTNSDTAQQEWEMCYQTDACLGSTEIKILSGSESTINGLDAYTATMQNGTGSAYHVTVIRGNKATSEGIPYVMFTTYATDQTDLATYTAIVASATFPN